MSVTSTEISSQPETWRRAVALTDVHRAELIAPGERMLVLGCGTSAHVANSFALLREMAGAGETDARFASEPALARRYDRVLAVSRSGTSTEVLDALAAVPSSVRKVALTAVRGMPVDGLTDSQIVLDFADERSVVQTRFPTACLALARAALGESVEHLDTDCRSALEADLPAGATEANHFVFLGSGWTVGLAHEAALKVREAARAHSESYPAMDYRHGPIAVAGPRSTVWFFGRPPHGMVTDVQATGANVVVNDLDPLAQLVLAQRLAVEVASRAGLDPDRPRNLTRSVI
ncbi:MAG: SIS domain-containing protein, partial [Kutzneria sp.]|nr:SIS domain-containing protein [Kutzneria sp.]